MEERSKHHALNAGIYLYTSFPRTPQGLYGHQGRLKFKSPADHTPFPPLSRLLICQFGEARSWLCSRIPPIHGNLLGPRFLSRACLGASLLPLPSDLHQPWPEWAGIGSAGRTLASLRMPVRKSASVRARCGTEGSGARTDVVRLAT